MERKRVWELDFIRGLALFLMLLDHLLYDFSTVNTLFTNFYADAPQLLWDLKEFGEWWFYESKLRLIGHYIFATIFLLVTGISYSLSRNNGNRCIKMWCMALLLSFVTAIIDSIVFMELTIYFGVLNCMALALTVILLLDLLPKSEYAMLFVGVGIIIGGIVIRWYEMPWYSVSYVTNVKEFFEVAVGLVRVGGDHFGILPSLGVVLVGAYMGKKFYLEKKSLLPSLDGSWNKSFCFIGRNTAWVYILHQPVVLLLVTLFGIIFCGMEVF